MIRPMIAALALTFCAVQAQAADRCYSAQEIQAERLIRLHSELMVITVTCKQGSLGQDLVRPYTGFTRNNIRLLENAEQALISHYKAVHGEKGAVDRLDRLRTQLANEYGQQIANVSAPEFCAQRRDKVLSMYETSLPAKKEEILLTYASDKTYEPSCSGGVKVASAADTASKKGAAKPKKNKKKDKS